MQTIKEACKMGWLQLTHWGVPSERLEGSQYGCLRHYLEEHAKELCSSGVTAEVRVNKKGLVSLWRKL